jgi:hypothetical protein
MTARYWIRRFISEAAIKNWYAYGLYILLSLFFLNVVYKDLGFWVRGVDYVRQVGPFTAFNQDALHLEVYLGQYLYYWLVVQIQNVIHVHTGEIIKLTLILAAIATCELLPQQYDIKLYLLPAFFLSGPLYGYMDLLYAPFLVYSLKTIDRPARSLLSYALAVYLKSHALIVAPVYLLYHLKFNRSGMKGAFWVALAIVFTVVIIFWQANINTLVALLGQSGSAITAQGFNIPAWINAVIVNPGDPIKKLFVSDVGYGPALALMAKVVIGVVCLFYIFERKRESIFCYLGLVALGYFTFTTSAHENHEFLALLIMPSVLNTFAKDASLRLFINLACIFVFLSNIIVLFIPEQVGRADYFSPAAIAMVEKVVISLDCALELGAFVGLCALIRSEPSER